jgi:hypothetical protein
MPLGILQEGFAGMLSPYTVSGMRENQQREQKIFAHLKGGNLNEIYRGIILSPFIRKRTGI